ncbi:hypothetical protein A6M21_10270 [Desulfotomaculum copahuensis]|uniref:Uncharacterized protein n=1 Tax=Desulfotomaculum copahuensis TaxID=1838280 RepID=A0A1B7LEQ3_9FIRM|nr:hypothetical protein A6M21_10270 [Desulfotomaculum copahuensis]
MGMRPAKAQVFRFYRELHSGITGKPVHSRLLIRHPAFPGGGKKEERPAGQTCRLTYYFPFAGGK